MSSPLIVDSRLKDARYESATCPKCKRDLEFLRPPSSSTSTSFKVKCAACQALIEPPTTSTNATKSTGVPAKQAKSRRIGTDEAPLDRSYYEVLGVPVDADLQAIKSAYRRLAIKLHPDKNPNDPEAGERFKLLALAYSTLSDPVSRHRYNEFGSQAQQNEDGFVDPEAVFSTLFGGDRFVDIIGTISLGQEMKSALQQSEEEEAGASTGPDGKKKELTPEEKAAKAEVDRRNSERRAKARAERVAALEKSLIHKLAIYTEQDSHPDVDRSVRVIWSIEAEELKNESYGVELLQCVGGVYLAKSRHYAASNSTPLGIGGWFHGVRSTAHVFSETVSTLRSAYELTDVFKEINAAEQKGLTAEQKKALEEKAATKAMMALFKGAKLEVESVIREVCDRVLADPKQTPEVLARRAGGLEILGEVYLAVKKGDDDAESEYVRIDAKRSSRPPPPHPAAQPPPSRPPPPQPQPRAYQPYQRPSRPM